MIVNMRYHVGGPHSSGGAIFFLCSSKGKKMEPIMSCPQGLTLSGKMCTVAPVLSCPSGYTLVNGMCQEDSGVQGFGDSMNIPPSDSGARFAPGELGTGAAPPTTQQPMQMTPTPPPSSQAQPLAEMVRQMIPTLPGEEMIPRMQPPQPSSPMQEMVRPVSRPPQIQALGSPMPMRPLSPQRRQQRMMASPLPPPPPPMRSPKPPPMRPPSPSQMQGSPGGPINPCPSGYSLNRMDGMCYPL